MQLVKKSVFENILLYSFKPLIDTNLTNIFTYTYVFLKKVFKLGVIQFWANIIIQFYMQSADTLLTVAYQNIM